MFANIDKKKALIYGGAGLCLLVLIMLLRSNSGGGSTSVVTTGPSGEQLNAQTQLALAQINASAQTSAQNAQLAVASQQLQTQYAEHQIDADVAKYGVDASREMQRLQITADAQRDATNAQLQASVAKWTLDNAYATQASNNAFQLDYASAANSSAQAMAQIQAQVVSQQIKSNENVTISSLQSQAAQLASYLGAQVAMSESDNAKEVAINGQNAKVTKHGQTTGLIGGIIGGALSLFSDPRLKTDVVLLGHEPDGLGVYSYRYNDSTSYQIGVMADEVAEYRPQALGPVIGGFATVNYGAL